MLAAADVLKASFNLGIDETVMLSRQLSEFFIGRVEFCETDIAGRDVLDESLPDPGGQIEADPATGIEVL